MLLAWRPRGLPRLPTHAGCPGGLFISRFSNIFQGKLGLSLSKVASTDPSPPPRNPRCRFRAEMGRLQTFHGLVPESRGQNMVLTVLWVPYSLAKPRISNPKPQNANSGGGGGASVALRMPPRGVRSSSPCLLLSNLESSDTEVYEP